MILYNEAVNSFAARPVINSRQTIKGGSEFLEGMTAREEPISTTRPEALRQPPSEGTLPIVRFMTDGLPTVGQTSEVSIREYWASTSLQSPLASWSGRS